MSQINQNFRKGKRRINRKHARALPFQLCAHGNKPEPNAKNRQMRSCDIMAAAEPQFFAPAKIAVKVARRMCGYVHRGPSRWWPHQNERERARRQRQIAIWGAW